MAYTSDRTGADIDRVLDNADGVINDSGHVSSPQINSGALDVTLISGNADNSNVGKANLTALSSQDADTFNRAGGSYFSNTWLNTPQPNGFLVINGETTSASGRASQMFFGSGALVAYCRVKLSGTWQPWQEIYHTGNTSVAVFGQTTPPVGSYNINIGVGLTNRIDSITVGTSGEMQRYLNDNGIVGSISVSGTTTAFNTSSDPRLKDFKPNPTDEEVNAKFSLLFDSFRVFNWKSDPEGELVWGFDAHKTIDNGLDMGSEGEGPRNLELGDVYETIPAEYEGRPILDEDGNETGETEQVEIKPEQELKVTPAGVDQSKAVPILLAKLEQLERRVKELENNG